MKSNYKGLITVLAVLGSVTLAAPSCFAQCGGLGKSMPLSSDLPPHLPHVHLLPAAFNGDDREHGHHDDAIVGMWHIKFVVPGVPTPIDAGYAQWHSDGTEIMNSGSRPPSTSSFCLGVWKNVGERQYELNHFAISWSGDPSAKAPLGPANIREEVTLDRSGDEFMGTFTIDQYDEALNVLAHVAGTITGTRITVDTQPSSIF